MWVAVAVARQFTDMAAVLHLLSEVAPFAGVISIGDQASVQLFGPNHPGLDIGESPPPRAASLNRRGEFVREPAGLLTESVHGTL